MKEKTYVGRPKKFSELDKQDIYAQFKKGISIETLARKYNCSLNSIRHCVIKMQFEKQAELENNIKKENKIINTPTIEGESTIDLVEQTRKLQNIIEFQHALLVDRDEGISTFVDEITNLKEELFLTNESNKEYESAMQELYATLKENNLCNKKDGPDVKLIHKVSCLIRQLCLDKTNLSLELEQLRENLANDSSCFDMLFDKINYYNHIISYLEDSMKKQIIENDKLQENLDIVSERFNDLVELGSNYTSY